MSAESLATPETAGTVRSMAPKRRSPVVARFEIISNDPAGGEAYQHTVTVQSNGRVRSVVTCVGREETVQEWPGDEPPTLEDLADLLVAACRDNYHESRTRHLSAVVHGLLPQGNHLWEKAVETPDAVFDASLEFGSRTTYRAEIQRALVDALQGQPDLAWVQQIQTAGTDAHNEFVGQIDEASTADPEWLRRSTEASTSGMGTPFDKLVAWVAQDDFDVQNPETWFEVWGESYIAVGNSWDSNWRLVTYFGRPTPGQVGTLVCAPEGEADYEPLVPDVSVIDAAKAAKKAVEWRYVGEQSGDESMRRKRRTRTEIYKKGTPT